jgi:hypothetical protein
VATNQPIMFGVHPSYITTRIKTKPDTFWSYNHFQKLLGHM